jgi:hypothetical protein
MKEYVDGGHDHSTWLITFRPGHQCHQHQNCNKIQAVAEGEQFVGPRSEKYF